MRTILYATASPFEWKNRDRPDLDLKLNLRCKQSDTITCSCQKEKRKFRVARMKYGEKLSREQQNLIGEPNKGCKAATFVGELILASPTSGILTSD